MRYRLIFKKEYKVSGRYPVNMKGRVVVFQDGVAYISDKETADYAKKLKFITLVEGIKEKVVEPVVAPVVEPVAAPVVEKTNATGKVYEVEDSVEALVEHIEQEAEAAESLVDAIDKDAQPTAEQITEMYDRLGTWTAVAKELDVTTTTLRKYREDAGLL